MTVAFCVCNLPSHDKPCARWCDDRAKRVRTFLNARGWDSTDQRIRTCPRVVLGKRCIRFNMGLTPCMCELWRKEYAGLVMDHPRIWRVKSKTRRYVMTFEPYGDFDNLDPKVQEFLEFVRGEGFDVEVSEDSPHMPGGTFLIVLSRAAEQP